MNKTLPYNLRLNDARKYKQVYFEMLSAFEVEILDASANGHVIGSKPGTEPNGDIVLNPGGKAEFKLVEGEQRTLDSLVHFGWLRVHQAPGGGCNFWLTNAAERLWMVLGRTR